MKSDAEEAFAFQIRVLGIVPPEREYRFLLTRRWRFDFARPRQMIAIEIEGGQYVKGRHNRPDGYAADIEKYNAAHRCKTCFLSTPMLPAGKVDFKGAVDRDNVIITGDNHGVVGIINGSE